jgi:hypothetical protein
MMDRGSFKNAPYNITDKDRIKQLREAERMMEPRKDSDYSEEDKAELKRMFENSEGVMKKAKGGMVCKPRGQGKARSKPCKIC